MDSQVKERLVGAAVLVALGVWLIPWVLGGPEDAAGPPDTTSPLTLPSVTDTTPVRTETIELDPGASLGESAPDAEETATEPTAVAIVTPEPVEDPTGSVAESVSSPQPLNQQPASLPEPAPSAAPPGGWSVQVGAFGEAANANQFVTRLESFGYTAYVSEFRSGGTTMYRVRVGGLESEERAEAAASALSARGIPVQVIAPE